MLSRDQVKDIANMMWEAAEEKFEELRNNVADREEYIGIVLNGYDASVNDQVDPLDLATCAVQRAEANGVLRYSVACGIEYESPEGFFASGDDEQDKKDIVEIWRDVDNGNDWAWCTVTVSCEAPGYSSVGCDHLGCCNYANEADFLQPGGYYDDMKAGARDDLICLIAKEIAKERLRA